MKVIEAGEESQPASDLEEDSDRAVEVEGMMDKDRPKGRSQRIAYFPYGARDSRGEASVYLGFENQIAGTRLLNYC
ncbi:hypothetical protein IQ273_30435 [Nodosilinea sp. LEGE 07298]|uniref:hypothetical protein n=1 Tax=Nodosilinea sp. LEGE 07298 TaxID=2777970 RepID=UPI001880E681|nr:hypothetical protein [Nodosilinea sp. LEGE 07298]MBE9113695.1 hypothetical protein [Nodosilinea sp. LEGE 07298]